MKTSKKILIDARLYGLENAGVGRYIMNLINELGKNSGELNFTILLRKKYFDKLKLPSNFKPVLADFRHYTFEEQLKLPGILTAEKSDLVHFPHLNIPLFWNGKFMVTIHDLTMQRQRTDATSLPMPLYYFKRLPFLAVARKAAKESVKIITPANTVKQDIRDYYGVNYDKIKVVYEGLNLLEKKMPQASHTLAKYQIRKPYYFYVGNAYPHKNLEKAMEASAILNRRLKEKVRFVIGGSRNVFTDRLEALIRKHQIKGSVDLIGYVEDKDLSVLYKESVAFIYPSKAEGYGLQGIEAMGHGTLVLASDIPIFREIYGSNAFYFDPTNASSIASSMETALFLSKKAHKIRTDRAKKFVTKYSWSKMAEETLQVYKSLI